MHPVLGAALERWRSALVWIGVLVLVEVLAAAVAVVLPLSFALAAAGRFAVPLCLVLGVLGLLVRAARRGRARGSDPSRMPHLPPAARTRRSADLAVHAVLLANSVIAAALLLAPSTSAPDDLPISTAAIVPGIVAIVGAPWSVWLTWRTALDVVTVRWEARLARRAVGSAVLAGGLLVRRWTIRVSLAINGVAAVVLLARDPFWS